MHWGAINAHISPYFIEFEGKPDCQTSQTKLLNFAKVAQKIIFVS